MTDQKWYCNIDNNDSYWVYDSEQEAINRAKEHANDCFLPGTVIKFFVGKCAHPIDCINNSQILDDLLEQCDDEIGSEEWCFDMHPEDVKKLGTIVRDFVRANSAVQCWYCNDPEAKQYTHIAGVTE